MKLSFVKIVAIVLAPIILTSCSAPMDYSYYVEHRYVPNIDLNVSPNVVENSLMVSDFIDNSPVEDREVPFLGSSVTNQDIVVSDLAFEVTNAIVSDFSNNTVFEEVSRKVNNPDYILEGEITRFMGRTKLTSYGLISAYTFFGALTWWLGMPVKKMETDVIMTVRLLDKDGDLVGTYYGSSSYFDRTSLYNVKKLDVINRTNVDFSNAVSQIREQIIKDLLKGSMQSNKIDDVLIKNN